MPSAEGVATGPTPSPGEVTRFRVMAWTTGCLLLVLVLVAMPLKYVGDDERLVRVVGVLHGWLYLAYLVTAFTLAYRLRWSIGKTVLVLLAGTVPFMSFVAERRVSAELGRRQDPLPGRDPAGAPTPPA